MVGTPALTHILGKVVRHSPLTPVSMTPIPFCGFVQRLSWWPVPGTWAPLTLHMSCCIDIWTDASYTKRLQKPTTWLGHGLLLQAVDLTTVRPQTQRMSCCAGYTPPVIASIVSYGSYGTRDSCCLANCSNNSLARGHYLGSS
jgi:hypothetical protein